jgi:hypothetical protein
MVPRLISSGQKWQLYGLSAARQLQIVRGEGESVCCDSAAGNGERSATLIELLSSWLLP